MHTYEIKNGKDVYIYNNDVLVQRVINWDSEQGAHDWGAAMVEKLDAEAAEAAEADG